MVEIGNISSDSSAEVATKVIKVQANVQIRKHHLSGVQQFSLIAIGMTK